LLRAAKWLLSLAISGLLLYWLLMALSPAAILRAFTAPGWLSLVVATLIQFAVLYVWDTISLWWLFAQPERNVRFPVVWRARIESTLWSAVNLEIGQGVFAWKLARATGFSIPETLGRCVVLGMIDFGVMMALGLLACLLNPDPSIAFLRWVCGGCVGGLLLVGLGLAYLPQRWRRWLQERDWGAWLAWWRWRHTLWLGVQRLVMFVLVLVYAGVGLALCGIPPRIDTVLGVIPIALMAEALPAAGGLGPKEAALVWLLRSTSQQQQALLFRFGVIWTFVVTLGRILVGLIGSGLSQQTRSPAREPAPETIPNRSPS
jgi:hypothetical protein